MHSGRPAVHTTSRYLVKVQFWSSLVTSANFDYRYFGDYRRKRRRRGSRFIRLHSVRGAVTHSRRFYRFADRVRNVGR